MSFAIVTNHVIEDNDDENEYRVHLKQSISSIITRKLRDRF